MRLWTQIWKICLYHPWPLHLKQHKGRHGTSIMIVLQHNCRKTYAVTIAILEAALAKGAGIVCLQEPYIGHQSISHPAFTLYWPEAEDRKKIRVVTAIKKDIPANWILEHRTDLINNTHIQCLDIWDIQGGRK